MRHALLFSLSLSLVSGFSPQYIEAADSAYTCNCILKDEYQPTTTTTDAPMTDIPLPEAEPQLPSRFWQLYNSQYRGMDRSKLLNSSFLDRVLSVFRRRLPTTPAPFDLQNDATGSALKGLGKTILTKYMERLRREWNVLDRFVCKCQGELWEVLKARNYLSLTILHD